MKKEAIFTSKRLIEDIVTGEYYRCYGVEFDSNGNQIIKVKSLTNLYNGIND